MDPTPDGAVEEHSCESLSPNHALPNSAHARQIPTRVTYCNGRFKSSVRSPITHRTCVSAKSTVEEETN